MGVSIEWDAGTIRYGRHHTKFGDHYSGAGRILKRSDGVEIKAAAGARITHGERKELFQQLREQGITGWVTWVRLNEDGQVRKTVRRRL